MFSAKQNNYQFGGKCVEGRNRSIVSASSISIYGNFIVESMAQK